MLITRSQAGFLAASSVLSNYPMNYNPFLSKTNWLQAAIIAIAVLNAVVPFLSPDWQATVTSILAVLAVLTHTATAQKAGVTN